MLGKLVEYYCLDGLLQPELLEHHIKNDVNSKLCQVQYLLHNTSNYRLRNEHRVESLTTQQTY